ISCCSSFFFFSSRRRHTRLQGDWSSDVCSSDLYHDLFDLARQVAADVRRGSRRAQGGLLPGRGRGSSVSSVVCYLLGLSHIDPVATRLFIGRFLNETLASVPDIDLDFPREIREELIRRVYKRYGAE